jgi:hypothetical protein
MGWNLGLPRTEEYSNRSKCIVDFPTGSRLHSNDTVFIDGTWFVENKVQPYAAFWLYRKLQMQRFVSSALWDPENVRKYGTPEKVAIGMNGIHDRMFLGSLIPTVSSVDFNNITKVNPKCTVSHLSGGKYTRSRYFCKVLLDSAIT